MDPIENLAAREAQELKTPGMAPQAMQEIRNELQQMPQDQALHFARALNRDLGGQSPLHERPEVVQGQNGAPVRTGNEILSMPDPYHPGQDQPVKRISSQYLGQGGEQAGAVPYQPGAEGRPGAYVPGRPGGNAQERPNYMPGAQQGVIGAADRVAHELTSSNPQMRERGMQELRADVYQMRPNEALQFTRRLNQDLRGQSPLHERPEVVPGRDGQQYRTGNEVLTVTDPSGREQVIKQVRHEFLGQAGVQGPGGDLSIQAGYGPGQGADVQFRAGGYVPQQGYQGQGDYVPLRPGPAYPPGGYEQGYEQPYPIPVVQPGLSLSINIGGRGHPVFYNRRPRW